MSHAVNDQTSASPRNKTLATALNCIFPGLGFMYLGKWMLGWINLILAQAIIFGALVIKGLNLTEHIHWVVMIVMVGSGSWVRSEYEAETREM